MKRGKEKNNIDCQTKLELEFSTGLQEGRAGLSLGLESVVAVCPTGVCPPPLVWPGDLQRDALLHGQSHSLIHNANTGTANRQLLPVTQPPPGLSYSPRVLLSALAVAHQGGSPSRSQSLALFISLTLPYSLLSTSENIEMSVYHCPMSSNHILFNSRLLCPMSQFS